MKIKTRYVCSNCGTSFFKAMGKCTSCGEFGTVIEELEEKKSTTGNRYGSGNWGGESTKLTDLSKVNKSKKPIRFSSGLKEFDRVLGGGIVEGSVILVGGEPGIGKSTILLQTVANVKAQGKSVLYFTGEENLEQISARGDRLNLNLSEVNAMAETNLERLIATIDSQKPDLIIVDSIQSMYTDMLQSAPGSVAQIRECSAILTRTGKQNKTAILLVGHVTKDGSIAGPKVLEHIVDANLFMEGETHSSYRLLRAFKNRFGPVDEIGAFEMTEQGLVDIGNISALFLSMDRKPRKGSSIVITQEGQRSMMIEIQALEDKTNFGNPRRVAVGVDYNRLVMILAVLNKHTKNNFGELDIFINAVGGIKINDTAADLAVLLSLLSSLRNQALPVDLACFGEVGLTGEVRPVMRSNERIKEAINMGFKRIIVPRKNMPNKEYPDVEIYGVEDLKDISALLLEWNNKS